MTAESFSRFEVVFEEEVFADREVIAQVSAFIGLMSKIASIGCRFPCGWLGTLNGGPCLRKSWVWRTRSSMGSLWGPWMTFTRVRDVYARLLLEPLLCTARK